jgi:hypothetical protein
MDFPYLSNVDGFCTRARSSLEYPNRIALLAGIINGKPTVSHSTIGSSREPERDVRSPIRSRSQAPTFDPSFGGVARRGEPMFPAARGESHETRFKRHRQWCRNVATVYL